MKLRKNNYYKNLPFFQLLEVFYAVSIECGNDLNEAREWPHDKSDDQALHVLINVG